MILFPHLFEDENSFQNKKILCHRYWLNILQRITLQTERKKCDISGNECIVIMVKTIHEEKSRKYLMNYPDIVWEISSLVTDNQEWENFADVFTTQSIS